MCVRWGLARLMAHLYWVGEPVYNFLFRFPFLFPQFNCLFLVFPLVMFFARPVSHVSLHFLRADASLPPFSHQFCFHPLPFSPRVLLLFLFVWYLFLLGNLS
ncbi:hypothetical protein BCR44DRAFT_328898 [Catenaria anguillulae PL171]|uniref:Uncharacterized protein n=1 Tax=Catenaria anguillulae PL171 TaxID=765915 RepID=A0A1Y2HUP5_9FUNG|nr:hypothetical protein BCR44DRAFT_328898 [Catenaria anguillulae PL171]